MDDYQSLNVKEANKEIERLRSLIDTILNSIKHGIYGVDIEGNITFINPEACTYLGYKEEELLGKKSHVMFHHSHIDGSNYPIEACPARQAIEHGVSQFVYDEVFWRKDGTSFPVEYYCTPIIQNNKKVGAIISFRDITDKKNLHELMIKSEKYSIIGELAAGIAHEIGNPLTTLKGFLQFFESGATPKQEYINVMKDELERIAEISKDILILARPDELKFIEENMIEIIDNVVQLMSTDAFKKSIKINKRYKNEPIIVNCIKNQMKQVFINLIKNSIEAMDGGEINISILKNEQVVKIMIADNGLGIPEEVLDRIGKPFVTTKETGTGLGIVVTKRIVENHHGSIIIRSLKGVGTTVTIMLPIIY